jgi:translation initiation factor IF-1
MSKGDLVELEGAVTEALGGGQYRVQLDDGGAFVRGLLSGRMKQKHIRVMPGDRVRISVSPYDTTHGIVTWRYRN